MAHAILTIGWHDYAIPVKDVEALCAILDKAVQVESEWIDDDREYRKVRDSKNILRQAVIHLAPLLPEKAAD